MPKRKRDENDSNSAAGGEEQGKSLRQRRVEHKLDHGRKLVSRAFKTAKGFERQKLSRRRKTACDKGDAKDVTRIDAETEAIKTLDFATAAKNYLYKSLLKFKAIAESPDLPEYVSAPPAPIGDAAKANVVARLCNSNPVKEALPSVLKDIQQALGVKIAEEKLQGKKRLRAKDFENEDKPAKGAKKVKPAESEDDNDSEDEGRVNAVMQRRPHSDNEDDLLNEEEDAEEEQDVGAEYDSEDFAQFDSRIAASSDDDDEDSDGGVSLDGDAPARDKLSRKQALRAAAMDISPSPSRSASPEPTRKAKKMERPTKSAFVPSLTMGGYWSGSESEPEDDDLDTAPRKNRRGQRARQAIAEKKFGQKAKHLQKDGAVSRNDRNQGWDAKRGATDGSFRQHRGGPQKFGKGAPRAAADDRPAKAAPPKKHRDDSGPLHPSWEAAKKAKEAKVTATFSGKKISFD